MIVTITSPKNGEEFTPLAPIKFSFTTNLDSVPKKLSYSIYLIDGINKQSLIQKNVDLSKTPFNTIFSFSEQLLIKKPSGEYKLEVAVIADKQGKQEFVNIKSPGLSIAGFGQTQSSLAQISAKISNPKNTQIFNPTPNDLFIPIQAILTSNKQLDDFIDYKFILRDRINSTEEIIKQGTTKLTPPANGITFNFKLTIPKNGLYEIIFDAKSTKNSFISSSSSVKFSVVSSAKNALEIQNVINSLPIIPGLSLQEEPTPQKATKPGETLINFPPLLPGLSLQEEPTPQKATKPDEELIKFPPLLPGISLQEEPATKPDEKTPTMVGGILPGQGDILSPTPSDNLQKPPGPEIVVPITPEIIVPKIVGTENIGSVEIIEEKIEDAGLQAPYLKTYLYQNGKNKVLFEVGKVFVISSRANQKIKKLQETGQYKIISNLVKDLFFDRISINVYASEQKPEKFSDIVNESKLFKNLNISDDETSFEKFLDVNKDFYFIVEAIQENNPGKKIYGYSGIQKIRVIKDQELYFIENNYVAYVEKLESKFGLGDMAVTTYYLKYHDFVDKEKIKTFLGKTFIEPKFTFPGFDPAVGIIKNTDLNIFTLKQDKFNSSENNNKYIKLRVTSKKTNRKIDINLSYSFLPNIQLIKSYEEIKSKDNKKLITTLSVFFSAADKEDTEAVLDFQFNSFMQEAKKFIQIYNIENNLQIYELPLENNKGKLKYSLANINNLSQFTMSFLEYVKKQEKTYNPNNFSYNIASKILATAKIKVI